MKRSLLVLAVLEAACASPSATTTGTSATPRASAAPPAPSAACVAARATRSEATSLDTGGHATLALAKLDEANAACPAERATSATLEAKLLADNLKCSAVRALPADGPGVKDALAACVALEAASAGTALSMRAKMHEAHAAERAKDWARAKSLYLAAWGELHPNPRAIESAARMAALGGDAAESRRLRDRALLEAEASEHAVAELTERVRVVRGSPHLSGTTLVLADGGNVVERDLATGELRVLVAGPKADVTLLSPGGTIAVSRGNNYLSNDVSVWDALTGELLLKTSNVTDLAVSPDDTRLVVRLARGDKDTDDHARVFDLATGAVVSKLSGQWSNGHMFFAPDAAHLFIFGEQPDQGFHEWSIDKGAPTGLSLASTFGTAGVSADGRYVAYTEALSDGVPLHVRDLVARKDVAQWTGNFHSVTALAISPDGTSLATGSLSSLRLWDVAKKKQTFKDATGYASHGVASDDETQFGYSDDGKTMILAGRGLATTWDVATGTQKEVTTEQPAKKVLRVVPAPDGAAVILEDEVRIVPEHGEPRTVCRGLQTPYSGIIGPIAIAFSSSGKSFACAMSDGWVHVLDASTWKETTVVKRGAASTSARPVDLVFSPDDKTLTVVSNTGWIVYDASNAKVASRFSFKHPAVGLAPRHARFDDGSFAVRAWNGAIALFGKDGAFVRDVKLDFGAPIDVLDAFSSDGTAYAVAIGKALHVVDLASGAARVVELPSVPKSLALSRDGKAIAVAGADKVVSLVTAAGVAPLATGTRAWMAGNSVLVAQSDDTLAVLGLDGKAGPVLELDPDGVVARAGAAFEVRGKPELECVVGKTFLERETCVDRAKTGLVDAWIASTIGR
ncbi:MAG TPA: WD40 repeat domain-containing protein [Polyangiaceae bacterium]|jgi:WD40 repeat protein